MIDSVLPFGLPASIVALRALGGYRHAGAVARRATGHGRHSYVPHGESAIKVTPAAAGDETRRLVLVESECDAVAVG